MTHPAAVVELPRPMPVSEVLNGATDSIKVPDNGALTIGPLHERRDLFRLAEVSTFGDLQTLGFVPEALSEETAVAAIRSDDRLHREVLRRESPPRNASQEHRTAPCPCAEGPGTAIRRQQVQDSLIDLLQPSCRLALTADHPAVRHVYRHLQAWLARPKLTVIGIFSLLDIDIGKDATLLMAPTVSYVFARHITIAAGGRLRFATGGVHVRCTTLNGPSRFSSEVAELDRYVSGLGRELRGDWQ